MKYIYEPTNNGANKLKIRITNLKEIHMGNYGARFCIYYNGDIAYHRSNSYIHLFDYKTKTFLISFSLNREKAIFIEHKPPHYSEIVFIDFTEQRIFRLEEFTQDDLEKVISMNYDNKLDVKEIRACGFSENIFHKDYFKKKSLSGWINNERWSEML